MASAAEGRPGAPVGVMTSAPWHDSLGDVATLEATLDGLAARGIPSAPVRGHGPIGSAPHRHVVIGGGDLLYGGPHEPWRTLLGGFRLHGQHALNAVGVDPETADDVDWGFAAEHLLVTVRDLEAEAIVGRHVPGARAVPCPATLVDPLPLDLVVGAPGHPELAGLEPGGYVVAHRHPAVEAALAEVGTDLPVVALDMQAWCRHPWELPGVELRTHSPSLAMAVVAGARAVVAHSLHLAIFAIGTGTPFSVLDVGDRQSGKVRRYLRRAGAEAAMAPPGTDLVAAALDRADLAAATSLRERQAASEHLDRLADALADVLWPQPAEDLAPALA